MFPQCKGSRISWEHLKALYDRDIRRGSGLALVPKLKYEHVAGLSSFAIMRVELAAQVCFAMVVAYIHLLWQWTFLLNMYFYIQVLSETVGKAMKLTGGPEAQETAKFILMFDKFFNALNVSNFTNGKHHRKPFKDPYRSGDDFRLAVSAVMLTLFHVNTSLCSLPRGWKRSSCRT